MAGLGSACGHLGALLYKLPACFHLKLNKLTGTSKLCEWNKSRKRAEPALLCMIDFSRPKITDKVPKLSNKSNDNLRPFSSGVDSDFKRENVEKFKGRNFRGGKLSRAEQFARINFRKWMNRKHFAWINLRKPEKSCFFREPEKSCSFRRN